jgi:hypothetical protein
VATANAVTASNLAITGVSSTTAVLGDYALATTTASAAATITPLSVTAGTLAITGTLSKTYDGTLAATGASVAGTVSGALAGDTLGLAPVTLAYNSSHAGLATTITASAPQLSIGASTTFASQTSDYNLTGVTITPVTSGVGITPAPVVATAAIGGTLTKVYDGTLAAPAATVSGSVTSGAVTGDTLSLDFSPVTLAYTNSHVVGANSIVASNAPLLAISSPLSVGSLASDYSYTAPTATVTAGVAVTAKPLTVSASLAGPQTKVYDGSTAAPGVSVSGTVSGAVAGDTLVFEAAPLSVAYDVSDVSAKAVLATGVPGFTFGASTASSQASDYSLTGAVNLSMPATITALPVANWNPTVTTGQWSAPANWDVLPTAANVLSVNIPAGATVTFDATAANTNLQTITSAGTVAVTGGNLAVANTLSTAQYSQTGGAVTGAGSLTVTNSFSQLGGSIAMAGAVSITQGSGSLTAGSISGSSITLAAPAGSINQTAPLVTSGLLKVTASNGIALTDAANKVAAISASTTGTGNMALTNAAVLDVQGITLASGNLVIDNTGAISNSGAIHAGGGAVSITAHSPITIGNTVDASGNITLAALTPDGTSNITLNGAMTSTAGGISIQAYNNFIQNSNLSAALAIDVSAGGSLSFGPGAYSVGNPVMYTVNGAAYMPPWIASTLSGGATDFVVAFLDQFQAVLDAHQVAAIDDPLGLKQRGQEGIVVEGEVCKP